MLKIISADLWQTIQRKAVASKFRRAAIAYVTNTDLLPLKSGDLLVTDASDASIAGGRTSAAVLAEYFESGVDLFCLENLHAKVAVLDDWAVIGSANVSQNSATYYVEAAVVTDRPDLVGQADRFVSTLSRSSIPIDKSFIDRISEIPVVRPIGAPQGGQKRPVPPSDGDQRFWFLGMEQDATYPGDTDKVNKVAEEVQSKLAKNAGSVDWFWWPTSGRISKKANVGDIVIECLRPHFRITSRKTIKIYKHARIRQIIEEEGVKAKAFLCAYPPRSEESARSWSSFLELVQRAGITRKLTPTSAVELTAKQSAALYELWES